MANNNIPDATTFVPRDVALIAIAGLLSIAIAWITTDVLVNGGEPCGPYVWFDVATVYFWGAVPAAWLLSRFVISRKQRAAGTLGAIVLLAAMLSNAHRPPQRWLQESAIPAISMLQRGIWALAIAAAVMLISRALLPLGTRPVDFQWHRPGHQRIWLFFAAMLFATIVPSAYLESRCSYFQTKLVEYLSQSRLTEARRVARQLCNISPHSQFNGSTLRETAAAIHDQVEQLEWRVKQPLPADCPPEQRIELARLHAILGHVEEAHRTLNPLLRAESPHPAACLLLGTAYESQEDWQTCLGWNERALDGLTRSRLTEQTRPAVLQAFKGIAYAQRKLGRRREAESAYAQALILSPTADMHFLLAQFYEDGQQAAKAQQHLLIAMQLDPKRFQASGAQMFEKLVTQHFGCLSVFFHRNDLPALSTPANQSLFKSDRHQ